MLQPAAGPVEVEQLVHVQVDAFDPDGRLDLVRMLPDESLVQHGYASASFGLELPACPRTETLPAVPAGSPGIIARTGSRTVRRSLEDHPTVQSLAKSYADGAYHMTRWNGSNVVIPLAGLRRGHEHSDFLFALSSTG
jgi:hypothetical protein